MVTESFFSLMCAGLIALLFGTALCFAGYKFFLFLLPIWGFFFGLALGAQTMQALFGVGFLATITSWVVGFLAGAVFALLAYLFYLFAVAVISFSLGYAVGAGLLMAIGMQMNIITWLVGIVVGAVVAFVALRFNLQKYVIIIATSVMGAGAVFATFLFMFYPAATILQNPVKAALQGNFLLTITFLVLAVAGIVVQWQTSRDLELQAYNRLETGTM